MVGNHGRGDAADRPGGGPPETAVAGPLELDEGHAGKEPGERVQRQPAAEPGDPLDRLRRGDGGRERRGRDHGEPDRPEQRVMVQRQEQRIENERQHEQVPRLFAARPE